MERIAVSLWRQKRLLKAETAQLKLERQPKHIAKAVEQEIYPCYRSGREISEYDLVEIDFEHLQHCRAILDEYNDMDSSVKMSVAEIETALPSMYQHLLQDATANAITPEQTLQRHETATEYFSRVADYCRDQLFRVTQKQLILDVAKLVKHKRAVLPEKARESLAKYQIMLDNELYKAIKALRETQAWRVNSLPAANELFVLN